MRIKKLELIGFKSFKDRTVIQFDQGITGVVGPNGCGKSNIVDALVWVMGEMSAKHLRGSSMEDVIFAGAEGYAPMGMSEVSLTLENEGGPFPAKYAKHSEVMVTRRLHRSGESEYLINKEPARLRDIQEIFMDTGAGSKGFSIIEQGAIGKIITSKPIDRRVLIEEAAGITKFKVRKRESQRKLISTDQNLVRLQDILSEQKRQLDSLERQAQRAERFRKLRTELQEKDLWLSSKQFLNMHGETEQSETIVAKAREEEAKLSAALDAKELQVQELKLELTTSEIRLTEKQETHQQLTRQVTELEFRIRELNMSIDQARKSEERTGSMLDQYNLRKTNLESELEVTVEKLQEAREEALTLEAQYNEVSSKFQGLQARVAQADQEITVKRRELLGLSTALSHSQAQSEALQNKISEKEVVVNEVSAKLTQFQQQKQDYEVRRNKIYRELEGERQLQLEINRGVETIQAQYTELQTSSEQKTEELNTLKDDLNSVASRLYGLENLQSNFEGFEDGVKSVMMWQKAESRNGFKPFSDVVEVHADYEIAMEAALGSRLQMLLSDSSDQSLNAVSFLKNKKGGRSSFVSGDLQYAQADAGRNPALQQEPGFKARLVDVVEVPEPLRPQVAQFLRDIVIVDSIRTALQLRTRYPGKSFVTQDGDVLSADGVLTGGAAESADSGVLRRRREIKELSGRREELSGKVQLAKLSLDKINQQMKSVEAELEQTKTSVMQKEILIAQIRKDLERAENELQNAQAAHATEAQKYQKESDALNASKESFQKLSTEITDLQARKVNLESESEALQVELEQSKSGIDQGSQLVTDLKIRLAGRNQELESFDRQRVYLEQALSEINHQLEDMSEESVRNQTELTDNQVKVETSQTELTRMIHQAQESERELAVLKNAYTEEDNKVSELEKLLIGERTELNRNRNLLSENQLKLEQLKLREDHLLVQAQERYQIDLKVYAPSQKEIDGDIVTIESEVIELRDKVRKIGDVNLAAIQEYDELVERYQFLNQQYQDLVEAKEHLRRVIDRINRICSRRFRETFEQVNARFQQVFPVLFGGGEASLMLVEDPEGEDDPGIDIVAKPPGKKLQSVSLMSGGEKALTAVALIFSIFLVKPSPFCLLDEVDAPLDDANVMRFNELVKEMAKRSQIIIVTHNKHTMKVNNKLYGVTMQDKGVSKMVSVSLEDAERLAEA